MFVFLTFEIIQLNLKMLNRQSLKSTQKVSTANSTLAIGGVSSPLDSFVLAESSVLRTNFCAEKPAHRQSANRYKQPIRDSQEQR